MWERQNEIAFALILVFVAAIVIAALASKGTINLPTLEQIINVF